MAVLVAAAFILSIVHPVESAEIAVKIPFGHGSKPKTNDIIEKLKNEETEGAGTAIALIILGACIVAAAVIIANKAEDIQEDTENKYDEEKADLENRYNKEKEEEENKEEQENKEEGTTEEEQTE